MIQAQVPITSRATSFVPTPHPLPPGHPTSVFFVDESGSKGSGGEFFVVGGIKTRRPGHLLREVECVRDAHRFRDEFKFSDLNRRSFLMYRDLVDVLAQSDAHLKAFVIDKRLRDPFEGVPQWSARASVTAQLMIGGINKGEVSTLLMDGSSTPKGIAIEEDVRERVNAHFGSTSLVAAIALDSRSTTGLQLADLVASAIYYDRCSREKIIQGQTMDAGSHKAQITRMLAGAFGLADLRDGRTNRSSILTSRARRPRRQGLAQLAIQPA